MKTERQAKILDLIVKKEIGTQEELEMELRRAGFSATQATISRDIREMKLTKVSVAGGDSDMSPTGKLQKIWMKNISAFLKKVFFLWTMPRICW